ncbi:MAG: PolC-type DNA polymerase III [Firmicutes bacterium]|nr:PolC-type DNA polymerase III [Bacillota bacterium]
MEQSVWIKTGEATPRRFLELMEKDQVDRHVLDGAFLSLVQVIPGEGRWKVHLLVEEDPGEIYWKHLEKTICQEVLGLRRVDFALRLWRKAPPSEEEMTNLWPGILARLSRRFPGAGGILAEARWEISRVGFTLEVTNEVTALVLQQRQVGPVLQAILAEELAWRAEVAILTRPGGPQEDRETEVGPGRGLGDEAGRLGRGTGPGWLEERPGVGSDASLSRVKTTPVGVAPQGSVPAPLTAGKPVQAREIILGKRIKVAARPISSVLEEAEEVCLEGEVFSEVEERELRSGGRLYAFDLTDYSDSITVKIFRAKGQEPLVDLQTGLWLRLRGTARKDRFSQELVLHPKDINVSPAPQRQDNSSEKRCELHLHTQMSAMDSVLDVGRALQQAARWGHSALAITDHGVIQAFPQAYEEAEKYNVKVILGVEGYLVDDGLPILSWPANGSDPETLPLEGQVMVVFDIETTGLSPFQDEIIEIGAVRVKDGQILDSFQTFLRPDRPLSPDIIQITGIREEMLVHAPEPAMALGAFRDFAAGALLVAHNSSFDFPFLRRAFWRYLGVELDQPVLDTLGLARELFPQLKSHSLAALTAEWKITLENHHRAGDDARATAAILRILLERAQRQGLLTLGDLASMEKSRLPETLKTHHITLLVQNQSALLDLYRLITRSHLQYFFRIPRIPRSLLARRRQGLLVGSACAGGEVVQALLAGAPKEQIRELVGFYDFLELQPVGNNHYLIREGKVRDDQELLELNRRLYQLGHDAGKLVVATGDVHFLEPRDALYREILQAGQGYQDADSQAPLYYRTTEEMLEEFRDLGEAAAREVVIENPARIVQMVEKVKPVPDGLHAPEIPEANAAVEKMAWGRARELYGDPLPPLVAQRLEKELKSIIGNGFAGIYLTAQRLVQKSLEDGYLVGSRGSVGSSFVATMCQITEVNPLPPHYRCPSCQYSEFIQDGSYGSGFDLPRKNCPRCQHPLLGDGQDIPFEVFLGFEGDKVPDIDLNFSGEYQGTVHKYTEELFGRDHVFRAGTIATVAEKTAFGFVRAHLNERGRTARSAEVNRLVRGITGVKRTTGQHPGGLMIVPAGLDINLFSPVQRPADDRHSETITTHFDYHSISSRLLKLDILGHDDPTALRLLEEYTGLPARQIPFDDPPTLALFSGLQSLKLTSEQAGGDVGTLGIPEFGTRFVRQMLEETRPKTFSELVRISGLSHGENIWLNNAQELIKKGMATLSEVISARDDIMVYLIYKGLSPGTAFKIMEKVRKGKGLSPEDREAMLSHGVPNWFIESCEKIKYMFPKAHAAAYVTMAFRIAYYKVHYPEAFYATYFTIRVGDFEADTLLKGAGAIRRRLEEITGKGNEATAKEKSLAGLLETALEMEARGFRFRGVDLARSSAERFLITQEGLLLPFLALGGLGQAAARNIVAAREKAPFTSLEDLRNRAHLSKTVVSLLKERGALGDLPETDQLALF